MRFSYCAFIACVLLAFTAKAEVEVVNGITWTYSIHNGKAAIGGMDGVELNEWKWNFTDSGHRSLAAVPESTNGSVAIPSKLGGKPVTFIGAWAFEGCSVRSVTIPSTVTEICDYAFDGAEELRKVVIPSGVKRIGRYAFCDCENLRSVNIPSSVVEIGECAFEGCTGLGSGWVMIDNCAVCVDYHGDQDSVDFSSGTRMIIANHFNNIQSIQSIPSTVTCVNGVYCSVGDFEVKIIDGCLLGIGEKIETLKIPEGCRLIASSAFSNSEWEDVDCLLKRIEIPASVRHISSRAFSYCTGLVSISVAAGNQSFVVVDGVLYDKDMKNLICCPRDKVSVVIPTGVERIWAESFYGCAKLKSVTIPSSVSYIGEHAFIGCKSLASLVLPASVSILQDDVFGGESSCGLKFIYFQGDMPLTADIDGCMLGGGWDWVNGNDYFEEYSDHTLYVPQDDKSWSGISCWYGATVVPFDGSAYVGVVVSDECDGMGTVTGGNKSFKAGAKVSLKATAKKGYVFAGWYDESGEPLAGDVDYRTPSYTYIASGEEDTTIYAKFIATGDDWVTVDCVAEDEYAKGETMTPIEIAVDSGSLATVKVTGLPTGMKFTAKALSVKATKTTDAAEYVANTIYGTPTKSGVYTVTVTATTAGKAKATKTLKFIVRGEGECIVDADVVLVDAYGCTVENEAVPGKVTGMGVYATNKKVTLKATANKGYVFMGWYEDGELVSRLTSYVLTMPDYDVALEARFITAETDRAAISASVGDEFWFDAESATAEKTISAGVYLEWPVTAEALSATTIKVTGLPTGLKFTTKPVTTKTTTGSGKSKVTTVVTNVPANTIYGTPSAASKTDKSGNVVPSTVKITVTTAGKNSQTFQIDTTVVALPEQVVGTFTGGSCDDPSGSATLTVAASGKVSGKWISEGKTWTLAATGFTSGEPDGYQFDVTLTAKCGKETQEIPLTVTSDGVASCDFFTAYWANWKIEPWKTLGKAMANKKYTFYVDSDGNTSEEAIDSLYGTVTLTMSANGTVKTSGSFVTGTSAKTGKDIVYKASGSTVLTPIDETTYRVFVYFPPKGTFEGFSESLRLIWSGSMFSMPQQYCAKPVIYLYPEEETSCHVSLELDGKLTCTYPNYGANGWTNFVASPDGTLTFADGSQYYCLFWEGETQTEWDFSHGYCVKGSDTAAFLADVLLQMGLSFREANEFIIYWLPLMQDNPYNLIAFQGENYITAARLTVDPQPESVLRVFMAWKPSARAVDIPAPVITPFDRIGFTVVEWGGTKVQ